MAFTQGMTTAHSAATATGQMRYRGEGGALFLLAFGTGLLTVLTLGIYRFWAKTRIRRYIWSSTQVDGDAFEYTGTGLEKLLGFLVSIIVLAAYLAVVQLIFFAAGLRWVLEPQSEAEMIAQIALIYGSFLAVLPLIFFAAYRARRYRMARTRFRGIRLGMESAAWGYVWRALLLWLVTLLSLGLLAPLMTFRLEKYMADRTWFGDMKVSQGGRWTALYGAMTHVFIGIGLIVAAVAAGAGGVPLIAVLLGVVGYIWLMVGFLAYRVQSTAYLMSNKRLGDAITFACAPKTGTVVWRIVVGSVQVGLILMLVGAIVGVMMYTVTQGSLTTGVPPLPVIVLGAVLYIVVLVLAGALSLVLITQPITAHLVTSTRVGNLGALTAVRQRQRDKGADAEGFADALDIGGAF